VSEFLLAPAFRGGRLQPVEVEVAVAPHPPLQIFRGGPMGPDLVLDGRSFAEELRKLVEGFREVTVAEFLITALEVDRASLFADVDNDGDQDLVPSLSAGPVLFLNDGTGRFTRVPRAFRFDKGLQGSPIVDGDGRLRPRRLPASQAALSQDPAACA
jgi:hypothetical protein